MIDALWAGLTVDWDMLRRRDMNFARENIFPMAPFDEATYGALRSDAAAFVRSRGPLPAHQDPAPAVRSVAGQLSRRLGSRGR